MDQGIRELGISERPKKYFASDRKPKKILSKMQNPKNTFQKHYSFSEIKAGYDKNGGL